MYPSKLEHTPQYGHKGENFLFFIFLLTMCVWLCKGICF